MALAAGVAVVAVVLAARHGRTGWHRHTGAPHPARLWRLLLAALPEPTGWPGPPEGHRPVRIGRLVVAGLAVLGLGVMPAGMALGAGSDSTAEPQPDLDDDRASPGGVLGDGPSPATSPSGPPVTSTAGS